MPMTADEIGSMVVSRQADGIALLASLSPFGTRVLSSSSQRALPIVIGCETIAEELSSFPGIHVDNVAAAREATNYLLELGHKRIAFVYGEHKTLLTQDRENGYREAMKSAGDFPFTFQFAHIAQVDKHNIRGGRLGQCICS